MSDNMPTLASIDDMSGHTKDIEAAANLDTREITASRKQPPFTAQLRELTYCQRLSITFFGILVAIHLCFALRLQNSLPHPYDYILGILIHSNVQTIY